MTAVLALAAAGVLAAASPADPAAGKDGVSVEAELVRCDASTGACRLEGNVVVRRGAITLRARTARYVPATGEVVAAGDVLLVDAARVVAADSVRTVLDGPIEAEDVVALVKDSPARLEGVTTLDAARRAGPSRVTLSGRRLSGTPGGRYVVDGARLTLCDCGGGSPSWELRASRADVVAGDRAILSWPVLWITPRFLFVHRLVPVLVVPWLYVPLGDRQSGLLLPTFTSSATTGPVLSLPVFVTLGESADATLTAEYAFGGTSVRGPGARLELRWAPAPAAAGRVELGWIRDLRAEPGGERGNRYSLSGAHAQPLAGGTLRVDLALFGDPLLPRDFTSDILARSAFYRRSEALFTRGWDGVVLEAGAAYYDPLSATGVLEAVPYGAFGARVPAFQRWPFATATLLPAPLAGPLVLSARAGVARFAPMSGVTNDSGADGLGPGDPRWPGPAAADPTERNGRWDPNERLAATRADVRAELAAPLLLGPLSLEPYLRGAALGYAFDAARDPLANAWGVVGARAGTEISRDFGQLRHAIAPRLEWRSGSAVAGRALPSWGYDAWDRARVQGALPNSLQYVPGERLAGAAPPGAFHQLRASVETRLSAGGADLLRLEAGQDADLGRRRLSESFAFAGAAAGPLSLDATARFWALTSDPDALPRSDPMRAKPSWLDPLSELRASVAVADRRGDALRTSLIAFGQGGSPGMLAGPDALFDPRPIPLAPVTQGSAGARVVLGSATLGYDVLFPARETLARACTVPGGTKTIPAFRVQQHTASFAWSSACRCFNAAAWIKVDECGDVSFNAELDLSRLAASIPRG